MTLPPPAPIKTTIVEVENKTDLNSIDWSKIPLSSTSAIVEDTEAETENNMSSSTALESVTIGKRIMRKRKVRNPEKPEVSSAVETVSVREKTKLNSERMYQRWGFLSVSTYQHT